MLRKTPIYIPVILLACLSYALLSGMRSLYRSSPLIAVYIAPTEQITDRKPVTEMETLYAISGADLVCESVTSCHAPVEGELLQLTFSSFPLSSSLCTATYRDLERECAVQDRNVIGVRDLIIYDDLGISAARYRQLPQPPAILNWNEQAWINLGFFLATGLSILVVSLFWLRFDYLATSLPHLTRIRKGGINALTGGGVLFFGLPYLLLFLDGMGWNFGLITLYVGITLFTTGTVFVWWYTFDKHCAHPWSRVVYAAGGGGITWVFLNYVIVIQLLILHIVD